VDDPYRKALLSIAIMLVLSERKLRFGRRIGSKALVAGFQETTA
jgi:hypothetical protein